MHVFASGRRTEKLKGQPKVLFGFRIATGLQSRGTVRHFDIKSLPTLQQAIRASEYTLYASIATDSPASPGPSGLSSDGYGGMVFWDADTWMFPTLLAQHPDLARVLVDYRYDTLPAARRNAANNGYAGALYPWTSGISGDMGDECYGAVTDGKGKVISDPNKIASCLPSVQSVEIVNDRHYKAIVKQKVGFISATFEIHTEVLEKLPW